MREMWRVVVVVEMRVVQALMWVLIDGAGESRAGKERANLVARQTLEIGRRIDSLSYGAP